MFILRNICLIAAAVLATGAVSLAADAPADAGNGAGAGRDVMQVRLSILLNDLTMEIESDSLREDVRYEPNTPFILGIGMSYNGLGIRLTNAIESGALDERVYGTTEYRDYRLYYYSASLCVDLMYQRYKGFFLDDPDTWGYVADDPPTIRGDIDLRYIAFNLYYVISERLSLPAAFEQTEIQRECGGSFILMASLQQNDISSGGSLFPPPVASQAGMEYYGGRYQSAILGAGYGYGFILGHFFFTPMIIFGYGVTRAQDDLGADSAVHYDSAWKNIIKFGLGYNGETFYWGVNNFNDGVDFFVNNDDRRLNVNLHSGYVEMYFGMKFDVN